MTSQELRISEKQPIELGSETHDQFVQRVSKAFPPEHVGAWSRLERLVFNQLMSRLIFKYGYGSISNGMLSDCRDEMRKVVHDCQNGGGKTGLSTLLPGEPCRLS